jgi:lipopolysaccharide transport system permease protein
MATGLSASPTGEHDEVHVIEPRRAGVLERVRELRRYRRLMGFFGDRAIDKLAARTVLGRMWLVLRPLLDVASRAFVFGALLNAPSNGIPYPVFFLAGATAWRLFESGLIWATRSLEINRKLLQKMYVPRLLVPIASFVPALWELGVYLVLLTVTVGLYAVLDDHLYVVLDPQLLAAVIALCLSGLLALALGIWTSILGANARDVRYSLAYFLGFWMFVTPVVYPLSLLPEAWRPLATVNPMTPVVELFRWGMFDAGIVSIWGLVWVCALIVGLGAVGLWYFGRAEAIAVDSL